MSNGKNLSLEKLFKWIMILISRTTNLYWEYTLKNYVPVGTYVYLIPVENPYFELSKYYDNSLGLKEIIKNNPNSNIIYL